MNPKYGTEDGPLEPKDRPNNLIRFFNCTNILISGVTIQNSPIWTVHFVRCERVNITGVSINSFGSGRRVPNDDGIDLTDTRIVHISDCDIEDGDDGIVVLGGERITVANCTLSSRSAAVRVGFAGGEIRDCVFANLVIFDSNRGLAVNVRGAGSIENVLFSDIVIQTRLVTGHWWGRVSRFKSQHGRGIPGSTKSATSRTFDFTISQRRVRAASSCMGVNRALSKTCFSRTSGSGSIIVRWSSLMAAISICEAVATSRPRCSPMIFRLFIAGMRMA